MINTNMEILDRPKTLKELAQRSHSLEDFGRNLRDWQHEISRRVSSTKEFKLRLQEASELLADKFEEGEVADAYLAAYADWLSIRANIKSPHWAKDPQRRLSTPWYADSNHSQLESLAPESFRIRGVYAVPESIFNPRRGRPRVSAEEKRLKAIERQRQYRERIKALVEQARSLNQ